ncbi:hypothetical protein AgCh_017772 [Apium graveolens]
MYSTNASNYEKSPQPSAPPAYQYGQPPPITGIPLQYSSEPAMWSTGLFDCLSDFPQFHLCCEPCALCQEHRELRIRGFDMMAREPGETEWWNGHGTYCTSEWNEQMKWGTYFT